MISTVSRGNEGSPCLESFISRHESCDGCGALRVPRLSACILRLSMTYAKPLYTYPADGDICDMGDEESVRQAVWVAMRPA